MHKIYEQPVLPQQLGSHSRMCTGSLCTGSESQDCVCQTKCTFGKRLRWKMEVDDMQLEPKANLLVVTELISKLEVQGHPAISSSCAFWEEVKLPAHIRAKTKSHTSDMQDIRHCKNA